MRVEIRNVATIGVISRGWCQRGLVLLSLYMHLRCPVPPSSQIRHFDRSVFEQPNGHKRFSLCSCFVFDATECRQRRHFWIVTNPQQFALVTTAFRDQ